MWMMAKCSKHGFATPEAARRQMHRVRAAGVVGASAAEYLCHQCGLYHWGHSDQYDKAIAMATEAHRYAVWPPRAKRIA